MIKLKSEENKVKVLVFSMWTAVLNILKGALDRNDIVVEKAESPQNLQRSLINFKVSFANVFSSYKFYLYLL